jgi:hypothetical protein
MLYTTILRLRLSPFASDLRYQSFSNSPAPNSSIGGKDYYQLVELDRVVRSDGSGLN